MELSQQVCTLEQAKRLKELGVRQDGVFVYRHWRGNGQIIVDLKKDKYFDHPTGRLKPPYTETLCSAFTVAELGEMLPQEITTAFTFEKRYIGDYYKNQDYPCDLKIWKWDADPSNEFLKEGGYGVCYRYDDNPNIQIPHSESYTFKNEAQARAAMLIYLLENKLINPSC